MRRGEAEGVYVPARGDLVWLDLRPARGHEQSGRRPALVLSPQQYHTRTGLLVACPVTSRAKGYPFEVALSADTALTGVILTDHVRSLDWTTRNCQCIEQVDKKTLQDTIDKLSTLLGMV